MRQVLTDAKFLEGRIEAISEKRSNIAREYSTLKKQLEEADAELNEFNAYELFTTTHFSVN
jgi:VIT1/CCC1 family predicted Fe2+/Mn2+ transporter